MEKIIKEAIMVWVSVGILLVSLGILIFTYNYQPEKTDKSYEFCMKLANSDAYGVVQNCQIYLGIPIIKN